MIRLLRLQVRRDWVTLPVWLVGIGLLALATTTALSAEFTTDVQRSQILRLALATPALLAFRGAPNGSSLGSLIFFQVFTLLAVCAGLMNTFLATRHGRADEERGRRELVLAAPVPRWAPVGATLLLGLAANVALGLLTWTGFVAGGLDVVGSAVAGAALASTGIAFLGVGVLLGELTATSRTANGIGAAAVLVAYAFRGLGDALGTADLDRLTLAPAWPSWLSPIGWAEASLAFTENRLAPLVLCLALGVVGAGVAVAVHATRDLGASLLPERQGPAAAAGLLRTHLGLLWRLQSPSVLGWAIGCAGLGVLVGSLATVAERATLENPQVIDVLRSLAHAEDFDPNTVFLAAVMGIVGVLASAAGLQSVLRLRAEETDGRVELALAAAVSRVRWIFGAVLVGTASVGAVLLATGAAAAATFLVAGDADHAGRAFQQALLELPAGVTFVGLAAMLTAVVPRMAVALSWLLFAASGAIGLFGELLDLPDAALKISPVANVPNVPVMSWTSTAVLLAVGLVLVAAALVLVRRRELTQ